MTYPTRLAVILAALGAPAALVVAVLLPAHWTAGLAWPLTVVLLTAADALAARGKAQVGLEIPASAGVGVAFPARVHLAIGGRRSPAAAEVALSPHPLLRSDEEGRGWVALEAGRGVRAFHLTPERRGTAVIERVWMRWRGPLGLAWRQLATPVEARVAILPDLAGVEARAAQIFQRHALQGMIAQLDRGDGADFDALVEYRGGMDPRAIDWKQSARHLKLHAKEYRAERNAQVVLAIDAGRQMSEPVAGLPRVDRAIAAALLTAWVALKLGDRVALSAFDARPRIASGVIGGPAAFAAFQRLAAEIDYSTEESNYSWALSALGQRLTRRSMIVLFTEFTDAIAADFLVRAAARLVERHLLLVMVLRDEELESMVEARPERAEDVTRAVTAAALLRDRRLALTRLRHLGVHIVEAEHDRVGERLVQGYLDLKRRNLL